MSEPEKFKLGMMMREARRTGNAANDELLKRDPTRIRPATIDATGDKERGITNFDDPASMEMHRRKNYVGSNFKDRSEMRGSVFLWMMRPNEKS